MSKNEHRIMKILLNPRISEKTTRLQQNNQYVFRVHNAATKKEIMQAVKELFTVEVEKVGVCNVKGKKRRFGRIEGRRKDWKKAYVTLKSGQKIDLGVA